MSSQATHPRALQAHVGVPLSFTGTEIMWMPAGVHHIFPSSEGESVELYVIVDRTTAETVQAAYQAHLQNSRQKPFFDFGHQNLEAAGWPQGFAWRDGPDPGVYAVWEFSDEGAAARAGKRYRAFSPGFFVDRLTGTTADHPARVTGAPLNMGGLTNDPAFRAIRPLFAADAHTQPPAATDGVPSAAQVQTSGPPTTMRRNLLFNPEATGGGGAAAAAGSGTTGNPATPGVAAAHNGASAPATAGAPPGGSGGPAAVTAAVAVGNTVGAAADAPDLATMQRQLAEVTTLLTNQRRQAAERSVEAAAARGAIPAQNQDVRTRWINLLVADPANEVLLAAQAPAVTLGTQIVTGSAMVTRDDVRTVLGAYSQARDPLAKGRIWAQDLRKRIKAGEDVGEAARVLLTTGAAVQGANSLGTLAGDLVVQRTLDMLMWEFPALTAIATDMSGEAAAYSQVVRTRIPTAPSVTDYNTSTGYADSDATATDIPVTLNAHKAVQIKFTVNELASTMRGLFQENDRPMHYSLGKVLVDAVYALITAGNFSNATTQAANGFVRATVITLGQALTGRLAPNTGRTLLLNSTYYGTLAGDSTIVSLAAYQRPEVITAGTLPPIHGFNPIEAPNLPTTGNLTGFAFTPSALALATRVPNDYTQALAGVPSTAAISVVTNPDTGFSVLVTQWVDHQLGAARARLALMYGVAVGVATTGQRLVSA